MMILMFLVLSPSLSLVPCRRKFLYYESLDNWIAGFMMIWMSVVQSPSFRPLLPFRPFTGD